MTDFDAFNEYEHTMWEQRAGNYAASFESLTNGAIELLLDAAGAGAGTRLLDIGTGPGFVAAAASARGAVVAGVDIAAAMLDIAATRVPGAEMRIGSAEALPFDDESFDAAVGNFVLLHLGHPECGAAELQRVLRPGGRGAFSVWATTDRNRALGVFLDAVNAAEVAPPADIPPGPPPTQFADHGLFRALLEGAQLRDVAVDECEWSVRVEPGNWWDATVGSTPRTGALIARQDDATRARIRECYDEVIAPYLQADGTAVLPAVAVVGSGGRG